MKKELISIVRKAIDLILVVSALPLSLIFRLVNMFISVRIAEIRASPLGHFVFDTEHYLRCRQLEPVEYRLFCYFSSEVPNEQWAKMVRHRFKVHPIYRYVNLANRLLPDSDRYEVELTEQEKATRDIEQILRRTNPEITFNSNENLIGETYLESIGLEKGDKFTCLLVRDATYKESLSRSKDWAYHSYRDSDVNIFSEAASWLGDNGYWVIRMGKAVQDEFRVQHPRIVDYSSSKHRSDFLDIWLMANCYFSISTGAGLDEVAGMAGKPGVFVNFLPLTHIPLYKQSITVPKKLVWSETGQLLSLREYIQNGYTSTEEYKENGITINSLTPTEIKQVVVEMLETMEDKRDIREEQKKRHEQLIQIILKYDKFNKSKFQFYRHPDARLGMGFLEANWDQLSR